MVSKRLDAPNLPLACTFFYLLHFSYHTRTSIWEIIDIRRDTTDLVLKCINNFKKLDQSDMYHTLMDYRCQVEVSHAVFRTKVYDLEQVRPDKRWNQGV